MSYDWLSGHVFEFIEGVGVIVGIFFSGLGFWVDYRARRAQTNTDITKLHRSLWMYFDERPQLHGLLNAGRDVGKEPLRGEELRFANHLFLHIRSSWYSEKAHIYPRPQRLLEDLRELFENPAVAAAWEKMKHLHDEPFVAFIEGARKPGRN